MDVRVQGQGLSPGVKHAQTAGLDLQTTPRYVRECSAGSPEQQVVEGARRMESDDVERLGYGDDHMEVRHRQNSARRASSQRARAAAPHRGQARLRQERHWMCSCPQWSHCCRCPPRAAVRHAPIARRALRCAAVVRRLRRKVWLRARTIAPRSHPAAATLHSPELVVEAALRTRSSGPTTLPSSEGETCVYGAKLGLDVDRHAGDPLGLELDDGMLVTPLPVLRPARGGTTSSSTSRMA